MDEPKIELYFAKGKTLVMALLSLIFLLICYWMSQDAVGFESLIGYIGVLFCSMITLGLLVLFLKKGAAVTIMREGMWLNTYILSPPIFVEWADIIDLRVVVVGFNKAIEFDVAPKEKYVAKSSRFQRVLWSFNTKAYIRLSIARSTLSTDFEEAIQLLLKSVNQYRDQNGLPEFE